KSIAAIERLTGQNIPRAEGDFTVHAEASEDSERPREQRKREGSKDGSRGGRKPRREREARHGEREARGSEREPRGGEREPRREREPRHAGGNKHPASKPQAPIAAASSSVPSIGRPEP